MAKRETDDSLESIAIIGMAGRFPGAKTIEQFWQNLCDGRESISFFTDEELVASGVDLALLNDPNYVKASPVLEDIEMFDASFFGFTPREAEVMDPQHRLFLECAWEALENAGYNSNTYEGLIGVYAGAALNTYLLRNLISHPEIFNLVSSSQVLIGNDQNFVPTRVSYKLNLKGPSVNVGTACSTSLVAVQMGCQSLLNYQCDMVLAGGVTIAAQKEGYLYLEGGIASPDGHCRAFDAKAQGTIGGNGVGIVVLKRLEEALTDGDCIYAVIKGAEINNDGSLKAGYTAPSTEGQAKVIAEALAIASVAPDTITYIETHGTGTNLGDPIEIAALTKVFRASTNKLGFCAIGSVKTNIGHLGTAAGVASLIKTILALKHQMIPPSLHFEQPNPKIDFANSPFYVNTKLCKWETHGIPRRAGVSSFGIGGTNAHIVLEEAPVLGEAGGLERRFQLLVVSAKTDSALETATINLAEYLEQHPETNLADAAYTLQIGRWAFSYRRMLVCLDLTEAIIALKSPDGQQVFTQFLETKKRSIAFMFPGQGAQYVNMSREVYQTEPIFRDLVDLCCEQLKPYLSLDLRHVLYPGEEQEQQAAQQLKQTYISQSALFVTEYALAKLWMAWGVCPQVMIGHSIGEYVAACLAGVFSLEDALTLVATRGRLMQQLPYGSILSVPLPEKEIIPLLGEKLSLAANNAPSLCVVSGNTDAINDLQHRLLAQGVDCRLLQTSHAFHSEMMNPILAEFTLAVKRVNLKPPEIPFVSNLTGTWITLEQTTSASYWAEHLRSSVRFSEGITELLKDPERILLEVGPGGTLSTFTMRHQIKEQVVLSSIRHPQDQQSDVAFLLNTLGRLWLAGVQVDWSEFYANQRRHRIPLPTYPFERQRYWIEPQKQAPSGEQLTHNPTSKELWISLVAAGRKHAHAGISDLNEQNYLENKQCLDRLCTAYINQALRRLGAFDNAAKKYSFEQLCEEFHILPRYRQLLCRFLDVLVEQGQLQQEQGSFTNLVPFSPDFFNTLLEEARLRFGITPQILEIVQQCGENLAEVLIGKKEPLGLYFAAVGNRTESSKSELPLNTYFKEIMRASLEVMVKSLPPNLNLRILEIGGGQGVVTAELLPVLPLTQTNYTFTDVGGLFLNEAKKKFSAYPFVEYGFLDIERPPQEQGYSSHSFDVVVAVNVLHVTRNLGKTLEHVHSLLAPGGFLLLWEITEPQLRFDITDGLLMHPLEDEERSRGNPFLSQDQWYEKLQAHRFVKVVAFSESEAFGHDVFVAQASALVSNRVAAAFTALVEPKNPPKKPNIADWFYIPSWKRSMLPQLLKTEFSAVEPGCWLVFVDECGLGEKMVKQLALADQDAIAVRVGEQFNHQSDRLYTINPQQRHDYDTLLTKLSTLGKKPKTIVHLWSVTDVDHPESAEVLGFYSLLFLAQAMGEQNLTDSIEIGIVSNNMQEVTGLEVLCPEKALVLGLCKVMPLEYPNITCRSIDIDLPLKQSWLEEKLIDQLLAEFTTIASEDQIIAYRGVHRWVQDFQPVQLDEDVERNPRLRDSGVYLITGGLGGVGLALAEYLAQTVQAKLILIGRSPTPNHSEWEQWLLTHEPQDVVSSKIRKLQTIEALGAEVMVINADITNREQMSAAIQKANHQFGEIHGVIHAAAVPGGGMIQLTTQQAVASALAPKVKGTRVLDLLFKETKLDFFVQCSSLSSFTGGLGIVDYTAENAFLDAFAHYRTSQNSSFTISINWDRWKGLGMAVAVEARHKAMTGEEIVTGMTLAEAIEAFRRILYSSTVPQIIVSTQDFPSQIHRQHFVKSFNKELASKPTHPRPRLRNAYVAPSNEIERTLADVWQQILGIELVGIHDNFFELGGDSLFAAQLVSRLCKTFEIELPYNNFFIAPTVAELAEVIIQKLTEQTDCEALAQALAEIEQLSEDEAQEILASQAVGGFNE